MFTRKHHRSQRRKPQRRRGAQRSRLSVESLEDRRLMAGDVSAYVSGSTLYINGDSEANHIEVRSLSGGGVQIENTELSDARRPVGYYTRAGLVYFNDYYTLINGAHSDTITAPFNNISVSMGLANDSVKIQDVDIPWDLTVNLGSGADTVDMRDLTVGDDVRVNTQGVGTSGYDLVKIRNSDIGVATTNGDFVVRGTDDLERVYVIGGEVGDDLDVRLTQAGESDRTYVYAGAEVHGNYYGATARIDSDYIYTNGLTVDGNGDFHKANVVNAYNATFENLHVDGTSEADTMVFSGLTVAQHAQARGLDGNDHLRVFGSQSFKLIGDDGDDKLEGGDGNDILEGRDGDDILLGKAGVDELFGGDDNDWLEAGSINEIAEGGNGLDWNAHRWTIDGQSATDVNQTGSSRCVVLAAIAGAVDRGFDLNGRITYLGNYLYNVKLFDVTAGGWVDVVVEFDGALALDDDGNLVDTAPEDTADGVSEYWVLLFQRAYSQHFFGIDPADGEQMAQLSGETFHHRAITAVTGWSVSQVDWWVPGLYLKTDQMLFNELADAIDNDEVITVGGTGHAYYVKSVFSSGGQLKVTLYNPWGNDSVHTPNSINPDATGLKFEADGSNDGMITMMISDMRKNFQRYFRTNH